VLAAWLALVAAGCMAVAGSDTEPPAQQPAAHDDHGITVFLTGRVRGAIDHRGYATCHDSENGPDFDRTLHWPKIQHGL